MTLAFGYVDTHLDDGRRHHHVDLAPGERAHHGVFLVARQPAVQQRDPQPVERTGGQLLVGLDGRRHRVTIGRRGPVTGGRVDGLVVAGIDPRAHDERLASGRDLFADALPGTLEPPGVRRHLDDRGLHVAASGRDLGERRRGEVTERGHRDRTRDRRGGHDQLVGRRPVGTPAQAGALPYTEAMLLVDDDQPEVGEPDARREERMGADDQAGTAARDRVACRTGRRRAQRAGEQHHLGGSRRGPQAPARLPGRRAGHGSR